jgi:glycosyltransferase involved in cell wall biosynthesis
MQGTGFVVMAVYRPDPTLLARQVSSLRAQTVRDWRCLVGVDGVDPEAVTLLKELVDDDERFGVIEYADNVGVYRHFERLLQAVPADAAWVSLADQDDYWYPEKLSTLLPGLERGASAVAGTARLTTGDGTVLGVARRRTGDAAELLLRNQVTGALVVLRPDVLAAALPFPQGTPSAIHDHWLAVCAASLGRVVLLPDVVQDYVQHDRNVLGEAKPLGLRTFWRSFRGGGGGVRDRLDAFARARWGWRVGMARALVSRRPHDVDRSVRAIAAGDLSPRLVRVVARNVLGKRLRPLAGLGALTSAARWRAIERSGGS